MKIALIQTDLAWENPEANRHTLEEQIWRLEDDIDIIILPEMFTTGFSMNTKALAEPMNLHTFKWMRNMAEQMKAAIMGSLIVQEAGHFYNRLIFMQPNGQFHTYDKRHCFTFAGEHEHYSPGNAIIQFAYRGWTIRPLICYDLRFPVWSRNLKSDPYHLLIYIANWPEARINAWSSLLKARAIENAAYCIGVNRVGLDGKDIQYNGQSAVIDFKGNELSQLGDKAQEEIVNLNFEALESFRKKFPVLEDADDFKIG